jgi:RNA polymerase sigma-70 factor (ECF subfamily)
LFKVAWGYCRHADDRADLIQEMTLQLWRAYPVYQAERASFSTWMYRVAMNVAISAHRQGLRADAEHVPLDEFGLDVAQAERLYDTRSDQMRTLDKLINELDEMSRALVLLFLDGRDAPEIGAILGLSTTNVTTRLTRVKQKLQTLFAQADQPKARP